MFVTECELGSVLSWLYILSLPIVASEVTVTVIEKSKAEAY